MNLSTHLPDFKKRLAVLTQSTEDLRGYFDIPRKEKRLKELTQLANDPAVWEKPSEMQKINKEKSLLEKEVDEWAQLKTRTEDALLLLDMAAEAKDEQTFSEVTLEVPRLENLISQLELKKMLSGEQDSSSTYLSVNSGAGGTEACDWANMLLRMYLRYCEDKGYKVEILDSTDGEGAGIKSATILVEGPYAYGYLKAELGVHRLVRISPFDSNARRHTSFASVFVWPEVDDDINIEIKTEDLKIDTFRAGGAGGQHVNKTDSAVRMTHIPTGIVVQCQNQRSQHANRDKALKMLKAALYEREIELRNQEKDKLNSTKRANEWGSQIRSYVLHPYQLVKDHRTGHETSQSADVLDGKLEDFIIAYLKSGGAPSVESAP
ncbi:MAG: peptide chain release factor 2 [Bdellovibrionales bacterium]